MRNRIARFKAAIRVARQVYREPRTVGINIAGEGRQCPNASNTVVLFGGGGGGGVDGPAHWDYPAAR